MRSTRTLMNSKLIQLLMIPVWFVLGVIPLIVRLKEVVPKDNIQGVILYAYEFFDYFSLNKALVLTITAAIMLVILFFFFDKQYLKINIYTKWAIGGVLVFQIGTVLSTIFSEHKEVAIWGMFNRAEGMITISCYVVVFLYSMYAFNEYKDIKFVVIPLIVVTLCNVYLGVYQYVGKDLYLSSEWLQNLIIPKELVECKEDLATSYSSGTVYGTLGHYNYMGSFAALIAPLFGVMIMATKDTVKKVCLVVVMICTVFLVVAGSRAGLVGTCVSIFVVIILMGKRLVKHWKLSIGVVVAVGVVLILLNVISSGSVFARIPSLGKDIMHIVGIDSEKIDYRDYIPIREFRNENGEVVLVLQEDEIHFKVEDGRLNTYDSQGEKIQYNKVEFDSEGNIVEKEETSLEGQAADTRGKYRVADEKFSNIQYQLGSLYINEESVDAVKIGTLDDSISFNCRIDYEQGIIQQVDKRTGEDVIEEEAPCFGFEGSERLGSARGYIWSRTIPMLKDTILIGKGPDTFFAYFTRQDSLAKYWAYGEVTSNVVVDKPHSLYLQIGYNEGLVALAGFLVLIGSYMIQCIRLYAFKSFYDTSKLIGVAIMASIMGYLVAGIFNDSAIVVAPIFWTLLGIGFAVNHLQSKELENKCTQLEEAICD